MMNGPYQHTRKKSTLIRFCLIAAALLLALPAFSTKTALAAGDKRRIDVVFDDSGSMINENRWSRAKYALEVFAAMLDEQDTLKVFALNSKKELEVKGSDANRVKKVHDWGADHGSDSSHTGTPFDAVIKAAEELNNDKIKKQYSERWLVVLTDGSFDGEYSAAEKVKDFFDSCNGSGIRTVYFGFGQNAKDIASNELAGGYSYRSKDSAMILQNVRDIANRIFQRLSLPADHINTSKNTYQLNIDVPTRSIIVFAQGEEVQIGDLSAKGKTIAVDTSFNVQNTTNVHFIPASDELKNESLKGVVAIYKAPANSCFDGATYSISVSGCREVEFYYDPAVNVDCELQQGKTVLKDKSKIIEGEYFVTGSFTNAVTGKKVTSNLLPTDSISLTISNAGKTYSFGPEGGTVNLEVGDVTVTATANLKTTTLSSAPKTYTVYSKSSPFVNGSEMTVSIRQDELKGNDKKTGNDQFYIVVQIIDGTTGEPADEDRWKRTTLDIKDQHGIHWIWTKDGMNCPEVKLIPTAVDKYSSVDVGVLEFTGDTLVDKEERSRTSNTFSLEVTVFEPLRIEQVKGQVNQKNLKDKALTLKLHLTDPYNNGQPITGDRWNSVKEVTITDGYGIVWDCQRGPGEGEYSLTPASADGKLQSVSPGTYTFDVNAVYDDGDLVGWKPDTQKLTLEVIQYPPKVLSIDVDVPVDEYSQARAEIKNQAPIVVTAKYQNGVIPQSVWNQADETKDISIVLDDPDQRLEFKITKGSKPGTWEIQPLAYDYKGYRTSTGEIGFQVSIDILDGDDLYTGAESKTLKVRPEPIKVAIEWVVDNLWWIIPTALFLFWFFAYVFPKKKHLRTGRYALKFVVQGSNAYGELVKGIEKQRSSVLIPFKAQRARLAVNCPDFYCTFPNITIESAGRNRKGKSFRILTGSLGSVDLSKYVIGGQTFDTLEDLKNATFQLASFSIETNYDFTHTGIVQII